MRSTSSAQQALMAESNAMHEREMTGRIQAVLQWKFQLLLVTLLLLFAVVPFFEVSFLLDLVTSFILIVAISAASGSKRLFIVCAVLALLAIAAIWTAHWIPGSAIVVTANCLNLLFFVIVTVVILSQAFRARTITRETVAGAICAYLLIGLMWAEVFSIIENVSPGSFSSGAVGPAGIPSARMQVGHFTYYSFVTMTTLGYGDITPLSRPARSLATLEAIIGQLYLAVLIARLVGQHGSSRDVKKIN